MGKIFISYRRNDARADARSIYQHLQTVFGSRNLFMDVDTIEKGRDFRTVLEEHLAECHVMLVIIGHHWLDGDNRLGEPGDFVRMEIVTALKRGVAVVPVLVDGAPMPQDRLLPDDLKPLLFRQAAKVSHEGFATDMEGLERDLKRIFRGPASRRWTRPVMAASALALVVAGAFAWGKMRGPPVAAVPEVKRAVVPVVAAPVSSLAADPAAAFNIDTLTSVTGSRISASVVQVDASKTAGAVSRCSQLCLDVSDCVAFDLSIVYSRCTLYSRVDSRPTLGGYITGLRKAQ
jgi:hypothetical protein